MSRRTRLAVLFNLVCVAVALAVFELKVDRRLDLQPSVRYDEQYRVLLNLPNLDQTYSAEAYDEKKRPYPFRYQVRTDAGGCRTGGTPSSGRLAVVGDSFSFGCHAAFSETLAGRLPEAADYAVRGTCSDDYAPTLRYYLEHGRPHPEVVAVGLYVDPIFGELPRLLARQRYGGYRAVGGYPVSPSRYARLDGEWARRLFLGELLLRRHSSLFNLLSPAAAQEEFSVPLPTPVPADLQAHVLANLDSLATTAALPHSQVVVHFIPAARELLGKIADPQAPPSASWLWWDQLGRAVQAQGYRLSDPRQLVEQRFSETHHYPFTSDAHLTGEGYGWISEPLLRAIPH